MKQELHVSLFYDGMQKHKITDLNLEPEHAVNVLRFFYILGKTVKSLDKLKTFDLVIIIT